MKSKTQEIFTIYLLFFILSAACGTCFIGWVPVDFDQPLGSLVGMFEVALVAR
ncbi:MAG: hypothetical protein ABJQ85_19275 [Rhizobiaceae bacterium]